MKKYKLYITGICVVFIMLLYSTVFAAPIYPAPVEFTQPNGDVITVTPYGDEFFSWKEDENGNIIAYDEESGSYKYAEIKENKIVPTTQTVGEISLFSVFSCKIQRDDIMPLWENAERIDYSKPNDSDGIQLMSSDETQETDGIKKLLTVLIEFENVKIKRNGEYWYKHMYSTNPHDISVVNYWKENAEGRDVFEPSDTSTIQDGAAGTISCDKYTDVGYTITKCPKGVVKVSLNIPHPIKTEDDTWEECGYIDEMIANILEPYFDFAGQNPYMIMVYATGDGVGYLHDHASQSGIKLSTGFRTQKVVCKREGYKVTYGIGVTCHELGHSAFDLPDLYFTEPNGGWTENGIMYYSLMSTGCWGQLCNKFFNFLDHNIWNDPEAYDMYAVPTHLDPWSKMQCGFLTPTLVNDWDGDINSISEMGDNSSYNVIEIRSKADANQYFLIENRQLVGYDAGLEKWNDSRSSYQFDGGIVIWHIDGSVFKVNNNNSHKHHFMQIEQSIPDDIDGISGVWEYLNTEGRSKLNADTTPNSNLHIRKTQDNRSCSRFKDCHPQTLKSGISIEVLGDNGTSVRVKANVDEEYRVNVLDNVKFTDVFPDVNFGHAVLDNLKKKDGLTRANVDDIMTLRDWATLSAIDDLQIEGYGIKDLTGIEYFPLLDWLVCNDNEITKLTPEQVPNMIFLDCSNNKLTELDLSQWPQLEYLFCDNNQLTELNVSNNEKLYSLTCSNNALENINLLKNIELWELDCSNNKLSNIDITNNPDLAILKCHENFLDTETPANTILGLDAVLEEIGEPLSKDDPDNWFSYYPQRIAEETPTAQPEQLIECVKITAEYSDGVLKRVKTENVKAKLSEVINAENNQRRKIFYWKSLESMKPLMETQDLLHNIK